MAKGCEPGVLIMGFQITAEDVKTALERKEKLTLVDVREPWEYALSRIEGARFMPMGDVPSRAHEELDRYEHIIVFCHHRIRSMRVVKWLRERGFLKAQSLSGGIDRWARVVDSKVPTN